jgi:integrase
VDNALRVHVLPALGDRPLASLRRSDVQGLVKALSESLSPGSVRNVHDVLSRVLSAAVEDRVIAHSPCRRIVLPALTDSEVVPPSVDDVATLSAAVPQRARALVVLLAGSGLRIGEALGLVVADVDFLRRTVRVERQRLQDGSLGPVKTAKSLRTVPLGQVVVDELAAHLAAYPSADALFTTDRGEPLTYRRWKSVWRAALASTGLDVDTHGLRHFTASALISGGASVKQVQTVLGHSSAAITLRVYSHLWPGDDDRTRSVMDGALGALADRVRTEDVV